MSLAMGSLLVFGGPQQPLNIQPLCFAVHPHAILLNPAPPTPCLVSWLTIMPAFLGLLGSGLSTRSAYVNSPIEDFSTSLGQLGSAIHNPASLLCSCCALLHYPFQPPLFICTLFPRHKLGFLHEALLGKPNPHQALPPPTRSLLLMSVLSSRSCV